MKDVLYRNQNPHTFDVPSLCRDLGFKVVGSPKAHAFVSRAGSAVRDAWIRRYGVRPQTALTRGSGCPVSLDFPPGGCCDHCARGYGLRSGGRGPNFAVQFIGRENITRRSQE